MRKSLPKHLIIFLISIFFFHSLQSNPSYSLTIKGTIIDVQSNQLLPSASIILFERNTNKFIKAESTNEKGNFQLNKISTGTYRLKVQYIGYQEYILDSLVITEPIQLPIIYLKPIEQNLNQINITGLKPPIEQDATHAIINVSESSLATGGSIYDLLKKTPGVNTKNESLSLRGKTISLFMDGRLINVTSEEMMDILKSLPASSVEKIELNSSPSGKYDGQVQAILNIKTIKAKKDDWSGNFMFTAGMGRKMRSNSSINLFYRKNKISFSTGWNYLNNSIIRFTNREFYLLPTSTTSFRDWRKENTTQYNNTFKFDVDYTINPTHSMGFSIKPSFNPQKIFLSAFTKIQEDYKPEPDSLYNFNSTTNARFTTLAGNMYYKTTFDTLKNKELIINADYYTYQKQWTADYRSETTLYTTNELQNLYLQLNDNPLQIEVKSATADYSYTNSLGNWQAGIKNSWISVNNQSIWQTYKDDKWILNENMSDYFFYTENIQAMYGGFTGDFKKINLKAFLRVEHTHSKGNSNFLQKEFVRDYTNFFPSLDIEYHASDLHTWIVSYQTNIIRPSYQNLNPFLRMRTANSYAQGNPYLIPEIDYNYSFIYSYKNQLFIQALLSHQVAFLGELAHADEEKQSLIFQKLNYNYLLAPSFSITFSKSLTPWWYINLYGDIYTIFINPSPAGIKNMFSNSFSLSSSIALTNNWNIELSGRMDTPWHDGYYKHTIAFAASAGIKKSFLDKKLNVSLLISADELPYWRKEIFLYTKFVGTSSEDMRYFMLSINYQLGSSKKNTTTRKSGIDSEKNRAKE